MPPTRLKIAGFYSAACWTVWSFLTKTGVNLACCVFCGGTWGFWDCNQIASTASTAGSFWYRREREPFTTPPWRQAFCVPAAISRGKISTSQRRDFFFHRRQYTTCSSPPHPCSKPAPWFYLARPTTSCGSFCFILQALRWAAGSKRWIRGWGFCEGENRCIKQRLVKEKKPLPQSQKSSISFLKYHLQNLEL